MEVTIRDKSFLKDLVFCACRYCVGRHTAASASMAADIATNAIEWLDDEDKRFLSHDIRRQINDILHYKSNINIYDYRSHIPMDALTRIVECIENAGFGQQGEGFQVDKHYFNINNEYITFEPFDMKLNKESSQSFISAYIDLLPWIKLANMLDKSSHYNVTYTFEGKTETTECIVFPYVSYDYTTIILRYMPVKTYLSRTYADSWISEEYIDKIEKINNVT